MVGDIAGILNWVMARDTDVALSPEVKVSASVVGGGVRRRNVHLRGWQRADLSNGEGDMLAERKNTPCAGEAMGPDGSGPKAGSASASGHLGGRGLSRLFSQRAPLPFLPRRYRQVCGQ
jgi:hypothetical protein